MAPHSSTLAWKIPWMEAPVRLQSMGLLRVGHNCVTSLSFSLSCIGEGNGNPLQCSCLENPRDGGAWWAAIYGVAQSWTRLKWFSIAYILLMYSCLTKFQVHSKAIKLYIYTYIIFQFVFHYRYFRRLTKGLQFPVLYSKTLLVVAHLFFKIRNLAFYSY